MRSHSDVADAEVFRSSDECGRCRQIGGNGMAGVRVLPLPRLSRLARGRLR